MCECVYKVRERACSSELWVMILKNCVCVSHRAFAVYFSFFCWIVVFVRSRPYLEYDTHVPAPTDLSWGCHAVTHIILVAHVDAWCFLSDNLRLNFFWQDSVTQHLRSRGVKLAIRDFNIGNMKPNFDSSDTFRWCHKLGQCKGTHQVLAKFAKVD